MSAVFALLALSAGVLVLAAPQDKYKSPYDNVDIDALLQDDSTVHSMLQCFISATDDVCSEADKKAKVILPEALVTGCTKCTEKQKHGMTKFFGVTSRKYPDLFKQLLAKYDPTGEHLSKIAGGHSPPA